VREDLAHGAGVGDEGDDSHLAATAWADERKDLIDPREQQRPGRAGRATQECFLCLLLAVGRRAWGGDLRRDWLNLSRCDKRRGRTLWHAGKRGLVRVAVRWAPVRRSTDADDGAGVESAPPFDQKLVRGPRQGPRKG
jgi:hypothetical protein